MHGNRICNVLSEGPGEFRVCRAYGHHVMARLWARISGDNGKLIAVVLPGMLHPIVGLLPGTGVGVDDASHLLLKVATVEDPAHTRLGTRLPQENDVVVEDV